MIITMTDHLRTGFTAHRVVLPVDYTKSFRSGEAKTDAMVISDEVEKLEERLEIIEGMFKEEEKRIGRSKKLGDN